jgi:hypothetical protein
MSVSIRFVWAQWLLYCDNVKDILKCYVSGENILDNQTGEVSGQGIISFVVPEYGVMFRCHASGSRTELEVIAFLSFLRFAEHNIEIFKKRALHIYSDYPLLVYLLNNGAVIKGMEAVVQQAQKYAKKIRYKVKWVDHKDNRAVGSVNDVPHMPVDSRIEIKTFANFDMQKPPGDHTGDLKM